MLGQIQPKFSLCFLGLSPMINISVNMDITVLGFYGYIRNIGGYFYINIGKEKKYKKYFKIDKNTFKKYKNDINK